MRKLFAILIVTSVAVAAIAGLGGCSVIGCTENQNSIPLAGFYSSTDGKGITIDSIAVGGVDAPDDSLLLRPNQRAGQVYLPLRSNKPSTAFYFKYRQKLLAEQDIEDVILIDYESIPWFASEDCGAMYYYHITSLQYSRNIIDSVAITVDDSIIRNIEREYLRIYFRTSTPDPNS
ncbi:MAG: hypothetical protein K2K55_05420 [Duncaniella sp.]|nr:hypothetical protein [Duncaniella sp.]